MRELVQLRRIEERIRDRRIEEDLPPAAGLTVAVELKPKELVDPSSLSWKREGIEVLTVVDGGDHDLVVLHIPDGKLSAFEKRISRYLNEQSNRGKPKNAALVNAIESFRHAAFGELWTDDAPMPAEYQAQWFQLWLRIKDRDPGTTRDAFAEVAERLGVTVERGYVPFPGRVVVAAHSTRALLEHAILLLDAVAEIRSVRPTSEFFLSDLTPADQAQWARNLVERTEHGDVTESAFVTLLDTGVAQGHPLIRASLDLNDMHGADSTWGNADWHGHGTEMAGLILHGNLVAPLAAAEPHSVPHRIESVNIYPPAGRTPYHLYGLVMRMAVDVVESSQPDRRRTFAMMTSCIEGSHGQPSEWSASIDQLAAGATGTLELDEEHERVRRLFVLSAGNVPWDEWTNYPAINSLSSIENPGQAWNAITVGAHTDLDTIDATKWPSYACIASAGSLSPSSKTSILWKKGWPFKPDVVAEGGNGSMDIGQPIVGPGSLRLLTTYRDPATAMFTDTGDTSAAAAEVSRLCAHLSTRYPNYWPETIRALVIHGARYTPAMRALYPVNPVRQDKENLLRQFGYGAVNGSLTLTSETGRPTLILQEEIVPYKKEKGAIKLNMLKLHSLPWPAAALQALGAATVEMRVTLSYFVDPNPSQRGWQSKFRYQSHGLRFAVQGATETPAIFGQRINKLEREEAEEAGNAADHMSDPDKAGWMFGAALRVRGSLHSDVWRGTGADLAQKSHIAVFPVGGWWKDWKEAEQAGTAVRYSLVVSLEVAGEVDVDLYTPIQTAIGAAIGVPIVTVIEGE
ncbi:S8 family peptidase [Pseudoxanthomonas winnipegensis]|jgi:hypothetical protein|nr:S8 family peptidase [Pseudoxanthomonas winnipegensis]